LRAVSATLRRSFTPSSELASPAGRARRLTPWIAGGLLFVAAETAVIWWRVQAMPLFWIFLLWTAAALALFASARSPRVRFAWINIAALIGALGLCEGLLWLGEQRNPYVLQPGTVMGGTFATPGYFVLLPVRGIGYRPRSATSATATRTQDGRLAYSVRYTVDRDGLRVSPPPLPGPASACLLMFGDSMAWGEGLNDTETATYQLGLLSGGRIRTRNFAFTGYSAHQMLWMVRDGEVAAKAHCDPNLPVLAVYQTLPNNVSRVAGLRGWDDYGPRFRLTGSDRLVYAGGFDAGESVLDDRFFVPGSLATALSRSVVWSRVFGRDRPPNSFDLRRFCVVVEASEKGLRRIYPKLRFLAIVWPDLNDPERNRSARAAAMVTGLRERGVPAVTVGELEPGFDAGPLPYLIPGDGHPNALMNRRLALALLARASLPFTRPS
jgi:hypothetical protein